MEANLIMAVPFSRSSLRFVLAGMVAGAGLGALVLWAVHWAPRLRPAVRETAAGPGDSRRNAIVRAVESAHHSVVTVRVEGGRREASAKDDALWFPFKVGRAGRYDWVGSGFFIDRRGYIITNEHVINGADHIVISVGDADRGMSLPATLVGSAPQYDLALLRVDSLFTHAGVGLGAERPAFEPARLGDSDDVMVGEWAIAIGSPFGSEFGNVAPSVSVGVISAVQRDLPTFDPDRPLGPYQRMIQTDAAINQGNSGGPLVNANGEVIGVNAVNFASVREGSTGIHFAIPINTARWVAAELLQYGEVRRPWIGWSVEEVDAGVRRRLQLPEDQGILTVRGVVPGSPAEVAGIRADDVLQSIQGMDPYSLSRAERILFGTPVGADIAVEVLRDGQVRRSVVHVEEDPVSRAERIQRTARAAG